ncbi:MAG: TonB-dependent receptor [Candidatus Symbiothrix sp.]|nr:TonB-dependent receptor [Candidatus Symbiothrix sp.]
MKVKKTLLLIFLLTGMVVGIAAQTKITVSGIVSDKNTREPMIGISVIDKNDRTAGAVTDLEGKYSISVPDNTVLAFSYLGYKSEEVPVRGRNIIDVQLSEDVKELETVVVVGAVMKKSDLTGAAVRLTDKDLKTVPTADVNKAMQGKIPGVYIESNPKPGQSAKIRVRGNNSIQYGQEPIYIVDNVMIDRAFESLNPDDIASIDILKDASATALYGARGANGVVVITTKKGSKGNNKITYDGWFGTQTFANQIPLISANDLFDYRVDAYANSYMDETRKLHPEYSEEMLINYRNMIVRRNYAVLTNSNSIFNQQEIASLTDPEQPTYNWLDEVTRTGVQQNHSLSFSGGSETGNYYLSLGYNKQEGQMMNSGYERYSGKVNLEQKVKPWLTIGSNSSFTYSDELPVANDGTFMNALRVSPLFPISEDYWYLMEGKEENQSAYNPLRDKYIEKQNYQSHFINSTFANIHILDGLDVRSTGSIDFIQREEYTYQGLKTTETYRLAYTTASHKKQRWLTWQWDNTASYNTTLADIHRLSLMAGANMSYYGDTWNQIDAAGFENDWFSYKSLGGATDKEHFNIGSDFQSYAMMSYWGRINYVFDSRYYLTATVRRDGSSRFGPLNKWGTFPSIVGSWNITGEEFMQKQGIFSNLRLRLGYGLSGNQNIPNYSYMTRFGSNRSLGNSILINDGLFGNPELRWETQKQFNTGLDVSVLNNRINLIVDYFHINNENLLMERSMPASSGYLRKLANVGAMQNQGVEISLDANVLQIGDFTWDLGATFSSAKNKITALYDGKTTLWKLGGYSNNEIQREGNLFVGESINNIYVYQFDRIVQESDMDYVNSFVDENGKNTLGDHIVRPGDPIPVDRKRDGKINDEDRFVVGNTDPDFYGGIRTEWAWKGLAFTVTGVYSVGADRISSLYEQLMSNKGTTAVHADMVNRWTPEHTDTRIPRAYSNGGRYGLSEMDWAIQDASFFRISTMTMAYNLPSRWLDKVKIGSLRLYVTGNNLFCFTNYKGFDPEGGDWYPTSKMWVIGVNLSF